MMKEEALAYAAECRARETEAMARSYQTCNPDEAERIFAAAVSRWDEARLCWDRVAAQIEQRAAWIGGEA